MTKKKKISIIAIGITLFSMFFGSGNLIFPPYLGYQAGSQTWLAMIGFSISAVIFPILAVIVIARCDDLLQLSSRVGTKFGTVFTILVFLSLGPGLAIPRNAAVSFEMAVIPFVGNPSVGLRIAYSLVFFTVAYLLSAHPERLSETLGKHLGPILLVLMTTVAILCFIRIPFIQEDPKLNYESGLVVQGFLDGYMTMDTLAALNFGNLIALNIMNMGAQSKDEIVRLSMKGGIIAGCLLFAVYMLMAYLGTLPLGDVTINNGANVLTAIVGTQFGVAGIAVLGIIYVLACLTTCVGLLCSCSQYFASISKMPYTNWVIVFTIASFFMSVVGLDQILMISVPVLNAMYPIAIVLVILGLFEKYINKPMVYRTTITCTAIVSLIYALSASGFSIPFITNIILSIPPSQDLCWLIPAIIGFVIGYVWPYNKSSGEQIQ